MERKSLSEILHAGDRERLAKAWTSTQAADEFAPIPPGKYVAKIVEGTFATANTGTPSYKLTFQIIGGEYAGRRLWHDCWLTEAALPMSKRDLGKLNITSIKQLEQPLPDGITCEIKVAVRTEDDGTNRNRVRNFKVVAIEPPKPDPFAPAKSDGLTADIDADIESL